MSIIANLVARFSADTSAFEKNTHRARRSLHDFSAGALSTQRALSSLARGLLAAAGVAGVGHMIKQQMEAVDATAKLADRLGMGTEALVGLQHGAKLAGMEQAELTRSLDFFNRKLGDMREGGDESKRILDQLGVSYKSLIEKSPDEAIGLVADRIAAMGTQSQKAAITTALFGRSSEELLTLFAEGSAGLLRYRTEIEKLGGSFSRLDAAKVEAANDALTRMRTVFTNVFLQLAIQISPYIEAAASAFVDWATAGEGVGARITSVFETVTLSIVKTGEEVERLIVKFKMLSSPLETAKAVTEANRLAIERYRKESRDIAAFQYNQGLLRPPTQPMNMALFQRIQAEEKAKIGFGPDSQDQISRVEQFFADLRAKEAELAAQIQAKAAARRGKAPIELPAPTAETKRMDALRAQVAEEINLLGQLNEPRQHAKMMIDFQAAAAAEYGKNTQQAIAATASFRMELDRLEKAESLARIADTIGQSFTTAFEDAIFEAKKFSDVMNEVGRAIQRALFQEFVSKPLSMAITGAAGNLFGLTVAPVAHDGGILGRDNFPRRWVSPDVFAHAPKYHGLGPGDVAVIAQKGEEISRPGTRSSGESLLIVNNFNMQMIDGSGARRFFATYSREVAGAQQAAHRNNFRNR